MKAVRVLLVDDERDFLQATARALARRGFEVTTAASAGEARVALSRRGLFDVAVLDVRLPDGDGHDLYLELRGIDPGLQAVILTGNRDEHRSFRLSHQGLCAYLEKPCDIDYLVQVLLEACEQVREAEADGAVPGEDEAIRVLLVDDEEDYVRSLARVLARRGLVVHRALSGEEGLQLLAKERVDVAVLDLRMPGMGGLEVLKRVKQDTPEVEVILLTGHATVEAGVDGMRLGAADCLFKPQDPDALLRRIQYVASRAKKSRKSRWWPFGRK